MSLEWLDCLVDSRLSNINENYYHIGQANLGKPKRVVFIKKFIGLRNSQKILEINGEKTYPHLLANSLCSVR